MKTPSGTFATTHRDGDAAPRDEGLRLAAKAGMPDGTTNFIPIIETVCLATGSGLAD